MERRSWGAMIFAVGAASFAAFGGAACRDTVRVLGLPVGAGGAGGTGSAWALQSLPLDADPMTAPALRDMTYGGAALYLVGKAGTVLRSNDDGASWDSVGFPATVAGGEFPRFYAVAASAADDVWIGGDDQSVDARFASAGTLRHSIDGGQSWQPVVVDGAALVPSPVTSLRSASHAQLVLANSVGELWRTGDAGATWLRAFAGAGTTFYDLWGDGTTIYAVGGVARSSDAGASGQTLAGLVVVSTDGGASWRTAVDDAPCQLWHVTGALDRGAVLAAGACGTVVSTSDAGVSWQVTGESAATSPQIVGAWMSPEGRVYLAFGQDICSSIDVRGNVTAATGCEPLPPRRLTGAATFTASLDGVWGTTDANVWAFGEAGMLWRRR